MLLGLGVSARIRQGYYRAASGFSIDNSNAEVPSHRPPRPMGVKGGLFPPERRLRSSRAVCTRPRKRVRVPKGRKSATAFINQTTVIQAMVNGDFSDLTRRLSLSFSGKSETKFAKNLEFFTDWRECR
jgi:hypothetical protein